MTMPQLPDTCDWGDSGLSDRLFYEKSPILHRRTLKTLAVLTVPSALSPDDENTRTTMSTALTRLLSRFGDDGCRLLPCDSPRQIRKICTDIRDHIVSVYIKPR